MAPVYCGPGLWYDPASGRIHVRLSHTHLKHMMNYEGETDPRKVPLVIAAAHAVPLRLDGAQHVRLAGLTVRGGSQRGRFRMCRNGATFHLTTRWAMSGSSSLITR